MLVIAPTLIYILYNIFILRQESYNYYHKYRADTMLNYLIILFNETFNNL